MKSYTFNVTLQSDVVLPATSNSEGKITPLDFIPGSNFLGMVATKYMDFGDAMNIFHSGKVRFGDATLLLDGAPTFKMPLSFFYDKVDLSDDVTLYNHHLIHDFKNFTQLKQKREGYITQDLKVENPEYTYKQKSAHDSTTGTSKEASMFGYSALKAGSVWQFKIKIAGDINGSDEQLLLQTVEGRHRLGKSKSAEYGQVVIERVSEAAPIVEGDDVEGMSVVYAKSRLALFDAQSLGATFDVKHLLEGTEPLYEKCQIRTSQFTPYNAKRQTKDSERMVINAGSVMVFQSLNATQKEQLRKGVGMYLSEGFGEVLINPPFLMKKECFTLSKYEVSTQQVIPNECTHDTLTFLQNRQSKVIKENKLIKDVNDFIKENSALYAQTRNSQWGTLRSLASEKSDENIVDSIKDFTSKGVAKDQWEGKKESLLLEAVDKQKNKCDFVTLLAMKMSKIEKESADGK